MQTEHVDSMHLMTQAHAAGVAGLPIGKLIALFVKYGLPIILQLLPIILPLLSGESKVSVAQALKWLGEAAAALAENQPLPPLPIGAK